ncbi:MAG: Fic family protein [Leadbetterella sp.]
MQWIWQDKNFPDFEFDATLFIEFEKEFYRNSGIISGTLSHLNKDNFENLKIEILTQEAVSTSSIEGEILKRESVQSSIRKHLGLKTDNRRVQPNETGIAEMMVDVYLNFEKKLSNQTLFQWHEMLMNGRRDIETIGNYRTHAEPMQIVSGNLSAPKVFYEAPPSDKIPELMEGFVNWYDAQITSQSDISTIVLAGIVHLYFEIIHPFEDGNGRIGRALVEKVISQRMNAPTLNSFAKIIDSRKKEYYDALQSCNHNLDINKWLLFFSKALLDSQQYTIKLIGFLIAKTQFFIQFTPLLNDRQIKVLLRVFDEGIEGFKGGLSAKNYQAISGTSPATATRDLQDLVNHKALTKTGELKHTRYFLNLE